MNDILEINKKDRCQTPEAISLSIKNWDSDLYLAKALNILHNRYDNFHIFQNIEDLKKFLFEKKSIKKQELELGETFSNFQTIQENKQLNWEIEYNEENLKLIWDTLLDVFFNKWNPIVKGIDRKTFKEFLKLLETKQDIEELQEDIQNNSSEILKTLEEKDTKNINPSYHSLNNTNHKYETIPLIKEYLNFDEKTLKIDWQKIDNLDKETLYSYITSSEVSDKEKRVIYHNNFWNLDNNMIIDMFASMQEDEEKIWFLTREPSNINSYRARTKNIFFNISSFNAKIRILKKEDLQKIMTNYNYIQLLKQSKEENQKKVLIDFFISNWIINNFSNDEKEKIFNTLENKKLAEVYKNKYIWYWISNFIKNLILKKRA